MAASGGSCFNPSNSYPTYEPSSSSACPNPPQAVHVSKSKRFSRLFEGGGLNASFVSANAKGPLYSQQSELSSSRDESVDGSEKSITELMRKPKKPKWQSKPNPAQKFRSAPKVFLLSCQRAHSHLGKEEDALISLNNVRTAGVSAQDMVR